MESNQSKTYVVVILPNVCDYRVLKMLYNNLHSLIYAANNFGIVLALQADETDEQAKFLLTAKTISLRGL